MTVNNSLIKVAVLRGGPSREYEVSLKTGASVISNLPEKYEPLDIFISKDGEWHFCGAPEKPEKIFRRADVIFNAMHGEYGEDGKVQQLLEHYRVPYTGSGPLGSALAMNKVLAKKIYKLHGLKTPLWKIIKRDEFGPHMIREIYTTFPAPSIAKPTSTGSSVGIRLVKNPNDLYEAILSIFETGSDVLLEEWISGKEATCGVIDNFREENPYSLPPVEIIPPPKRFFDYEAKYSGESQEICPGNFSSEEKKIIQGASVLAHDILGLRHYSRTDFIVHPRRGVYILETNSLPGLTSESLFPKSLNAVGSNLPEFLDHVINKTLGEK